MAAGKKGDKVEEQQGKQPDEKAFKIIDREAGIFQLWDAIHEKFTRWQIAEESGPGIVLLLQRLEEEGEEIRGKNYKENYHNLSDKERGEINRRISAVAQKQLAVMSTYVQPLDPIPKLLENKIEFLAACLSHDADAAKINAFFLMKSTGSMTSLAALKGQIDQMMEKV